jgi:hypothetical protein
MVALGRASQRRSDLEKKSKLRNRRNVNFEEKITVHKISNRTYLSKTERGKYYMSLADFSRIRREIWDLLKREKCGTLRRDDKEHLRGLEYYVCDQETAIKNEVLKKYAIHSVLAQQRSTPGFGELLSKTYHKLSKSAANIAYKRALLDEKENSNIAPTTCVMVR